MERIEIKNFGPIKDVNIEIKDINVFIGTTSSGKSTVAKLISIFKYSDLTPLSNTDKFKKRLLDYNIDFDTSNAYIKYTNGEYLLEFKNNEFYGKFQGQASYIWYIPAERMLIATLADSIFGLLNNDVSLPKCIKEFGKNFETARRHSELNIDFLKIRFEYRDNLNKVILPDGTPIRLEHTSSGFQSIIPMMAIIENLSSKGCLVIEEPELNLYPTVQKDLIEHIIEKVNKIKSALILTTHSPYVLTTIDNLIQAKNAADKGEKQKAEVARLIDEKRWVDFDRVSCYYFEDGTCRSTLDIEDRAIGSSNIDNVSDQLGATFEKLLQIQYQ